MLGSRADLQTYDEVIEAVRQSRALGDGYDLREVKRWTVHCSFCGVKIFGDTPQTQKAFEHLKRRLEGQGCRNPNCVSNGGKEVRKQKENDNGRGHQEARG